MGVHGLLSHCMEHKGECVEYVDLVDVARRRHGIEILVDFYSFQQLLVGKLWQSLEAVTGNPYMRLQGGEYHTLDAYLTKLVRDLQSLDIHLVMYVDGSKGSCKVGTQQKMETWKKRHYRDLDKCRELLEVCQGRRRIEQLSDDTQCRPVLLEIQVFETLKNCNCEVVQVAAGEADFVIARGLLSRPRAYCVLSNDSDFCMFRDSMFIPNSLFDLENDLQLGGPQTLPDKPLRLMVGIIASRRVANMLGFLEYDLLTELSIIAGNDFTGPHILDLKKKLGLLGRKISHIANWVKEVRRVENNHLVLQLMHSNRAFAQAVQKSREFYSVMNPEVEVGLPGFLYHMIREGVQQGQYAANIMSMHLNKFYWHRMLLEECHHGQPSAEGALAPLRSYIYRMILDRPDRMVVEYGRTPYDDFSTTTVHTVQGGPVRVPPLNFVNKDKIFQNFRNFHFIMLHQEPDFQHRFFDRYGRKNGALCYMLRYFLVLNTGYNLHIEMGEYMAVIAVAFCRLDPTFYHGIPLRPTPRCVTVGNWFQDVYRHAFLFLGKLLCLTHEFPQPKEVFNGAIWTAFYMMTCNEGMLRGHLSPDVMIRIRRDLDYVIREKRHMIRYLVQDIFDFNPRF